MMRRVVIFCGGTMGTTLRFLRNHDRKGRTSSKCQVVAASMYTDALHDHQKRGVRPKDGSPVAHKRLRQVNYPGGCMHKKWGMSRDSRIDCKYACGTKLPLASGVYQLLEISGVMSQWSFTEGRRVSRRTDSRSFRL